MFNGEGKLLIYNVQIIKYCVPLINIFAYARLKNSVDENSELYYDMDDRFDYSLAQELTNRAILTLDANRAKSDMNAHEFLTSVKQKYPNALNLQCIPENEELWKIENYKEFLQKRSVILPKINTQ